MLDKAIAWVTRRGPHAAGHGGEPLRYVSGGDWWCLSRDDRWAELKKALSGASSDQDERQRIAKLLVQMADRAWDRCLQYRAYDTWWRTTVRVAGAATGAAAAVSGSALLANLHGSIASVLGVGAIIVGVIGGVGTSLRSDQMYEWSRTTTRQYEQMWRDVWAYALVRLPKVDVDTAWADLEAFSTRLTSISGQP